MEQTPHQKRKSKAIRERRKPCPTCGAKPGELCLSASGSYAQNHAPRKVDDL